MSLEGDFHEVEVTPNLKVLVTFHKKMTSRLLLLHLTPCCQSL
jgi:hypothetical protein